MTGKTHLIVAGSLALAASSALRLPTDSTIISVVLSCVGGLIPDIDHKNSMVSKELKVTGAVARTLGKHRGLFHAPLFWAVAGAVITLTSHNALAQYVLPFLFGILTHLFLDCLTPAGLPLFWPVSKKKVHIAKIKTGGVAETLFCVLTSAAAIVYTCFSFGILSLR